MSRSIFVQSQDRDITVSVCVPTFRRPRTLRELVLSYVNQDFSDSELCIVDDNSCDNTSSVVSELQDMDNRIRYFRNRSNIGYCRNLLQSIMVSRGKYVIILGDDDLFARRDAVSRYLEVFERHPNVYFAYSNLIQINNRGEFDLAYPFFIRDTEFLPGRESLESTWVRSVVITGIALRVFEGMENLYPVKDMLFPQVELVGKILLNRGSFGISDFLCAYRSHDEQLGYYALRGQRIKSTEREGNRELFEIWKILNSLAPVDRRTIERAIIASSLTNTPNEKIRAGNRAAVRTYLALLEWSRLARFHPLLWSSLIASLLLPSRFLVVLRSLAKGLIVRKYYGTLATRYEEQSRQIQCLPDQ